MAETLIEVTNEILLDTGQNSAKTEFKTTDSTSFIRNVINRALQILYGMAPTSVDVDGSLILPASTRSVAGPSGLDVHRIYEWSWRINNSAGDIPLKFASEQYIITTFPDFEVAEAIIPTYVYIANNTPSYYPLLKAGQPDLTIQFKYAAQYAKLVDTTATFPFEDGSEEMLFVKLYAKLQYQLHKLMGNPDVTATEVDSVLATLEGKYARLKKLRFRPSKKYGG